MKVNPKKDVPWPYLYGQTNGNGMRHETYNFIKKETPTLVFSFEFGEIVKNSFFAQQPWEAASATGLYL